jgi:hypothetical protein
VELHEASRAKAGVEVGAAAVRRECAELRERLEQGAAAGGRRRRIEGGVRSFHPLMVLVKDAEADAAAVLVGDLVIRSKQQGQGDGDGGDNADDDAGAHRIATLKPIAMHLNKI